MTDPIVLCGDALEQLALMPADSFDSCVTDPPYHLTTGKKGGCGQASVNLETPYGRARIGTGFMGMKWDGGDIAMQAETWAAVLRVLKPGAYLLAFGGTRTHHRIWCAIEDAGFELRDTLGWLYGSGFPKGTDKAKIPPDWQGWNTALKPAWEPICLARKPMAGTLADNLIAHGVGAMNIQASRVAVEDAAYARNCSGDRGHEGTRAAVDRGATDIRAGGGSANAAGRWPANILHDGSDEVLAAFPDSNGQCGNVTGDEPSTPAKNVYGTFSRNSASILRGDRGSAARFFWCPKASRADRGETNTHPTVKPTELMRYLVRLVKPAGGQVLDPFCGSGSTGRAALLDGFGFTGIELEAEYAEVARSRMIGITRGLLLEGS
jgi:site-specific DNA-methyltransferase (adenine-specific)